MFAPDFVTRFVNIDRENNCIYLPEFSTVIKKFCKWYTHEDVTSAAHIWGKKKLRPKLFFEKYGTTAKNVAKWINGAQKELWIHGELTTKLAMRRTGLSAPWVRRVHHALPHLQQAQVDGLDNLLPIIAVYEKSPHDIKKIVGKSAWIKLSHNSFTRNKKLALIVDNHGTGTLVENIDVPSTLLGISHSLLRTVATNNHPTLKAAAAWLKSSANQVTKSIIIDTVRMAQQLGATTNLKWSLERWHQEHEHLTKLINERRYSSEPFTDPHEWVDEDNNLKAVRLISAREIADEGASMHHCVAGYAASASEGLYYVYSIRDMEDRRVGTLGLRLQECTLTDDELVISSKPVFDQLVGPCNKKFEHPFYTDKLISSL